MDSAPAPPSPVRTHRQETIAAAAADPAPVSTETPVGRRGRLANLAAVIGSWEDDLAPAGRDNAQGQPGTVCSLPVSSSAAAAKTSAATRPAPANRTGPSANQVGPPSGPGPATEGPKTLLYPRC